MLRNWARLYNKLTPAELHAEKCIALLGKRYRAQHPFFSKRRIVDFALLDDKVLIEVDGSSHDLPVQRRKDLTSTIVFEEEGWAVVRFSNATVQKWVPGVTNTAEIIADHVRHRPTLGELREALRRLDRDFPALASKTRKPRRAPGPKKARKRAKRAGSTSVDTTE